jgi:integrase
MRGHVRKRGKSWSIVIDARGEDGRRRRRWISGTQHRGRPWTTRRAAEDALPEVVGRVQSDRYIEPSTTTLGAYLGGWLERVRGDLRPSTWDGYRRHLSRHVLGRDVARVTLQRLRASDLSALYARLLADGKRGGQGLSPRTVRLVHSIIRKALQDAVEDDPPVLLANPADRARAPGTKATRAPRPTTWTAEELRAFLAHVRDDRLYAAWLTLATTGMRRGEILGLPRRDLQLDEGALSVTQTLTQIGRPGEDGSRLVLGPPKSDHGRRSIALDPKTVAALRAHLKRQAEERLAWGPGYYDGGFVFAREDGSPLDPDELSKAFKRHVRAAGLPSIRLHDLRHGVATLMLRAGVHPKVVQERLGHHSAAFTLDAYSHVTAGLQEEAATRIAGLIFSASGKAVSLDLGTTNRPVPAQGEGQPHPE